MSAPIPTQTTFAAGTHVVLWMRAETWPLTSTVVAADEVRRDAHGLTLSREGRVVFQARVVDVAEIEPHPTREAAQRALKERRATRGRGGLRVEELAPARPTASERDAVARGAPAEGVSFRIEGG